MRCHTEAKFSTRRVGWIAHKKLRKKQNKTKKQKDNRWRHNLKKYAEVSRGWSNLNAIVLSRKERFQRSLLI